MYRISLFFYLWSFQRGFWAEAPRRISSWNVWQMIHANGRQAGYRVSKHPAAKCCFNVQKDNCEIHIHSTFGCWTKHFILHPAGRQRKDIWNKTFTSFKSLFVIKLWISSSWSAPGDDYEAELIPIWRTESLLFHVRSRWFTTVIVMLYDRQHRLVCTYQDCLTGWVFC